MKPLKIILGLFALMTLNAFGGSAQEITLSTTTENTARNRVEIDLPGLSGNPLAVIVATPLGSTETLNPHPVGAWYYGDKWNINNTDGTKMIPGLTYRIEYFPKPGANQFLHVITKENLVDKGSYLDHPALNNKANAQVKILQNHAPSNRPSYNLNRSGAKVVYNSNSGKWCIANVNGSALYPNTAYNIVITPDAKSDSEDEPPPPPPWISVTTKNPIVAQPPSTPAMSLAARQTTSQAPSQTPCTEADSQQKTGSWGKQDVDDLAMADASFPKQQYKPVSAKAQKAIELLKQANPQPTGISATAQRSIRGNPYTPNGALKFGVTARYFGYLCTPDTPGDPERGKILPGGETDTKVVIYFNGLGSLANLDKSLGKGIPTVNGEVMFFFPKQAGELKGLTLLSPGLNNPPQRDEAVIIASGNRSPFKPVTREQYLHAYVKLAKGKIKKMQETLQGSAAANEKTFAKVDSNNFFNPQQKADIKAGILKQTKQLEESYQKQIENLQGEIARIELAISRLSPAGRERHAVIKKNSEGGTERDFVPETDPGSIRLVTIDKGYYDPALPRQTIQLIVVYWSWNEKNAPKAELIRQFKQNFDFEALKQMLGK